MATKKNKRLTYGEHHQEKWPEVIKHFGEEIPPQARIRRQVRECQPKGPSGIVPEKNTKVN
jgi:hypothetical protein